MEHILCGLLRKLEVWNSYTDDIIQLNFFSLVILILILVIIH